MAERIRRPRRDDRAEAVYNEEMCGRARQDIVNGLGIMLVGPTLIHWGTEEQKKPLRAEDPVGRGNLVPGLFRAGGWLRRGVIEYARGRGRRLLHRQRAEGMDLGSGPRADWCILLVRTDPEAPKHKGISYLLVDMHSPGVTVRPLVQMTGEKGFNEVFFEDVKVPKKNLVGEKNQGWEVAVTTLMFERSSIAAARDMMNLVRNLAALAKRIGRNGGNAWDDTGVRQKIASFACEAAALRYGNMRQLTRRLKGLPPGPEGSIGKLSLSDLNLKMAKFALELMGPYSQLGHGEPQALDGGNWNYRMLASRAFTIAGGTSEIQHNIIGERVLGLPKG